MSSDDVVGGSSNGRFQTLGVCWIVYGIIRLVVGVCLVIYSGTATVMFGALLNRVPDPFTLMSVFHFTYVFIIFLSALCGVLGLGAGFALLMGRRSGRAMALTAAFFSVSNLPLGTTLGIYTLVVLLPARIA